MKHPRDYNIRLAKPGEESRIHDAHMRSIREVCVKDHGEEEIKGWGNRELGERWIKEIETGLVWVIEKVGVIFGVAYLRLFSGDDQIRSAYIHPLYLTPEALGKGYGKNLLKIMIEKAKEEGPGTILLESSITALAFYKRSGFVDNGPMRKLDVGGYPVTAFPIRYNIDLA